MALFASLFQVWSEPEDFAPPNATSTTASSASNKKKQRLARIRETKANEDKLCQQVVELICRNGASNPEKQDQARHAFNVITNIIGIDGRGRWLRSLQKDEDWSHAIVALIQHVDANMDKQSKEATTVRMDFWRMWRSSRPEEDE
jgi:hypothetical protein